MTRSHLLATVALCTLDCGIAQAQTVRAEPAAPSDLTTDTNTDVIVSGYRASLETAREQKRQSAAIIDAIAAEDISQFPDNSATEALNRLPGVTTQETRGERQSVTVRGLSQVLTTVNGMEDYTGISRQTLPGSMHHHLAVDRGGVGLQRPVRPHITAALPGGGYRRRGAKYQRLATRNVRRSDLGVPIPPRRRARAAPAQFVRLPHGCGTGGGDPAAATGACPRPSRTRSISLEPVTDMRSLVASFAFIQRSAIVCARGTRLPEPASDDVQR